MDKIRIAFFDIDGTLIDMEKKQISQRTVDMLRRLQTRGVRICLATGRSPLTLPKIGDVTFDAYLTFNGSLCYTQSKTIFSNPIPPADVQMIIKNAARIGRPVSVAARERIAANGADEDLIAYYAFAHRTVDMAEDFDEIARGEIYQLMLGCREAEYAAVLDGVHGAKIAAWWDRAIDVIPADGGKGVGIEKVLEYFGVTKEEAIAFGDGNNDIDMLKAVGCGVAMANASDALKAAASDVCGHVAEDGVYHYCLSHGLI